MDKENKRVVPGCPKCRKRFYTVPQFLDHIGDDVLPPLLDRLSSEQMATRKKKPPPVHLHFREKLSCWI
jgi:hypothetical protein